jgi:thiosulfate reductase cytochrome b subunit
MNPRARARRSARRVVHTVTGLGRSIGAAVTGNRRLEEFEYAPLFTFGALLLVLAGLAIAAPAVLAWTFAVFAGWTGMSFIVEAIRMWRRRGAS